MSERISLINPSDEQFSEAIEIALRYLRSGEVIIAAAEHGYVYLANAFDRDAVNAIQILRANPAAITLQVLVRDKKMASGVSTAWTVQQENLLDKFCFELQCLYRLQI